MNFRWVVTGTEDSAQLCMAPMTDRTNREGEGKKTYGMGMNRILTYSSDLKLLKEL